MANTEFKTQDELFTEAEEAVKSYRTALEGTDVKDIQKAKDAANAAIGELNVAVITDDYSKWSLKANPFEEAIREFGHYLYYLKEKRNTETKMVESATLEKKKDKTVVDLVAFEGWKKTPGLFANNGQWRFMLQKFAYNVARMKAGEIDAENKDMKDYAIDADAAAIILADTEKNEFSVSSLMGQLQKIVDGVLYKETVDKKGKKVNSLKVLSMDVKYVSMGCTSKGKKALSINVGTSGDRLMHELLVNVMHRILTDGKYSVVFPKA